MHTALPSGTVTFLFTDVEGSTRILQRLGDRAQALLTRHHEILAQVIEGSGGVLVSTEGDGLFAAFASPHDAIRAVSEAQRRLQDHPWEPGGEIWVRMGLHTGEGRPIEGDYQGLDVHRAARIAASASGGQVVLSEATAKLVANRLPDRTTLRDLGLHRLKDLEHRDHLYQLNVEGLRNEFPPLRSLDAAPHNLPEELTSFVGRDEEIAQAFDLLSTHRLLTITGPGGIGKTRFSLRLASNATEGFDGVSYVPLASISDPDLVTPTIGSGLGLAATTTDPIDRIVDHLSGKRWLLVLDNFEHLTPAVDIVADLLRRCPALTVLATSRGPLRISGEWEYPLAPLPVPDTDERIDPEQLLAVGSVRLFVDRATAIRPGFTLDESNAAAVAEIAVRLEGLPLAIELAAARTGLLSPRNIADRLGDQLSLLTSGARDLPRRQQTLRAAIGWSHDLLDDDQRRLFRRCAVFMGGATLEVVERVCAEPGALDLTADLIDQGLLQVRDAESDSRVSMLEPIRQYALEQLEASGESSEVRDRHLEAFVSFAAAASPRLTTIERGTWLDLMETERDNLRAALTWAVTSRRAEEAFRLVYHLWRFWHMRGPLQEAEERIQEVLELDGVSPDALLRGLEAAGGIAYWKGDVRQAISHYQRALDIANEQGDESEIALAEYNLAFLVCLAHDPARGFHLIDAAMKRFERVGDRNGVARTLWGRGTLYQVVAERDELPNLTAALEDLRAALAEFERLEDLFMLGWSHRMIATTSLRAGDLATARRHLVEAIDIFEPVGDTSGLILLLRDLTELHFAEERFRNGLILAGALQQHGQDLSIDIVNVANNQLSGLQLALETMGSTESEELIDRGSRLSLTEAMALSKGNMPAFESPAPPP